MREAPPPPEHRSGFVAVAGKPNVGKSTLINRFVGQSIAAVSARPQTTQRNQLGIVTRPLAQAIFVDTPGLHRPHHKLGHRMNTAAEHAIRDADQILVVLDAAHPPEEDDRRVAERVSAAAPNHPVLVALNKADSASTETSTASRRALFEWLPASEVWPVSALHGTGVPELLDRLLVLLPHGPVYFPEDQVTDAYERDLAGELIRAACLHFLRQEVPYSIAVYVEEFRERATGGAYLAATLYVERESQKAIVVGTRGQMMKQIGTRARLEIEALTGRRVFLDLRVKVQPGWRDDEGALERFGYAPQHRDRPPGA